MDNVVATPSVEQALAEVNAKLDALTTQVQYLAEQAQAMQRRQQAWEDLQQDLEPILREAYQAAAEELAEVAPYVTLEDVLHLVKRLLRNVPNLEFLLEQLESLSDLRADAGLISHEAMAALVEFLEDLERKGYFAFAREALRIVDIIVTSFTPEDVRLLGDNIVLILDTVKEMTQPEIMRLLHNLTSAYREAEERPEELPTSTLALLRQMRDPDVRRGLTLTMQMLKIVAQNRAMAAKYAENGGQNAEA